uniref:Uncharacterized protein n=1 Tax=Arundo donax TaxID=35708 RepID=A0A0A9B6X1_ARUDO
MATPPQHNPFLPNTTPQRPNSSQSPNNSARKHEQQGRRPPPEHATRASDFSRKPLPCREFLHQQGIRAPRVPSTEHCNAQETAVRCSKPSS